MKLSDSYEMYYLSTSQIISKIFYQVMYGNLWKTKIGIVITIILTCFVWISQIFYKPSLDPFQTFPDTSFQQCSRQKWYKTGLLHPTDTN